MTKLSKFLKREKSVWGLVLITMLVGGFSIWTSNYLYKTRSQSISPASPESQPEAAGNCTLNYGIPTPPPCTQKVDVVGISIDRSSSMNALETDGRKKVEWAKDAARTFVGTLKGTGTTSVRVAVNSFGAQGTSGGTLSSTYNSTLHQALTGNYDSALTAINNVRYVVPGTCIMCGLRISNNQVQTSVLSKKVAILISDGKANHNWDGTTSNAKANAIAEANAGRAKGVEYHVIGYGTGTNIDETTLRAIAGTTGSYQYKPNVADWSRAMLTILGDICTGTGPTPTSGSTLTSTPTPSPAISGGTETGTRLSPTADAYVSSGSPNTNYGSASTLRVDGASPVNLTYMKFDLTSLAGRTVTKAYLRLYVTNRTTGTLNIKRLTTNWFENSVTYNTRPTLGSLIRTFNSPTTTGVWASIELTTYVNNNKGTPVTFAVETTSSDDFVFNARGASTNKPYLLIQ